MSTLKAQPFAGEYIRFFVASSITYPYQRLCSQLVDPPAHFLALANLTTSRLDFPHVDNAANAVSGMHVVEGIVDATEVLSVGDELVDLELAA